MELPFLPTNIATNTALTVLFFTANKTYFTDLHLLKMKTVDIENRTQKILRILLIWLG